MLFCEAALKRGVLCEHVTHGMWACDAGVSHDAHPTEQRAFVTVLCFGLSCSCVLFLTWMHDITVTALPTNRNNERNTMKLYVTLCRTISPSRSGWSLSCGCTNHVWGMWSGSRDWTFSRTASVQSLSSSASRPAPPPPSIPKLEMRIYYI